jgi:molybdate transport system substrate-binding protein
VKPLPTFLCIAALLAATFVSAAELTVFAAASLSDALKEAAPLYAKTSGDTLRFNFGASGALTRQIREGAPADIIVSADELRVDQLEKAGLLLPGTRRTVLANSLVLVVASDTTNITTFADLTKPSVRRVVFGDPATVPVGTYSKEHLSKLALWEPLQNKSVFVDNVRAVLAAVESGNADAGIVYKTDALISRKVKIAVEVALGEGPSITYPAAVVKETKSPDSARKLVEWFSSAEAQAVFAKHGFLPPN